MLNHKFKEKSYYFGSYLRWLKKQSKKVIRKLNKLNYKRTLHIHLILPWNEAKKATFVDRLLWTNVTKEIKNSNNKFVYQTMEM